MVNRKKSLNFIFNKTTKMNRLILFTLFFLSCITARGTTTAGVSRNLLINGFVGTSSLPGTNDSKWETDEVYQGYQGIVNWYLTWDDTNLYIGRKGFETSNTMGSILYIRAQYPNDGDKFSNTGFDYDGVKPDLLVGGRQQHYRQRLRADYQCLNHYQDAERWHECCQCRGRWRRPALLGGDESRFRGLGIP